MFKVLVVEDDINTSKLLKVILQKSGYEVTCAYDGMEALECMDRNYVDIIILDAMLPKMGGFEFAKTLRENSNNVPILMVTAKELVEDKVRGLDLGIDDYIVKPIDERELVARMKALQRRYKIATNKKIVIGSCELDFETHSITKNGEVIILPKKEFQLLFKLLSYPNKIFTRIQIMDEIWGMESTTGDITINVHINRLRNRLGECEDFRIVAIKGVGYKAVVNDEV